MNKIITTILLILIPILIGVGCQTIPMVNDDDDSDVSSSSISSDSSSSAAPPIYKCYGMCNGVGVSTNTAAYTVGHTFSRSATVYYSFEASAYCYSSDTNIIVCISNYTTYDPDLMGSTTRYYWFFKTLRPGAARITQEYHHRGMPCWHNISFTDITVSL